MKENRVAKGGKDRVGQTGRVQCVGQSMLVTVNTAKTIHTNSKLLAPPKTVSAVLNELLLLVLYWKLFIAPREFCPHVYSGFTGGNPIKWYNNSQHRDYY